jgi:hypothetical protein
MADSFMPPEKIQKIGANKHKFDNFDSDVSEVPTPSQK